MEETKIQTVKSSQNLIEILNDNKDKFVILDIYAHWCGPCKILGEELRKSVDVENNYSNMIFLKLDVDNDECLEVVENYTITSIPRVFIFHNNKIVKDITGLKMKELFSYLDANLSA